MVLQQYFFNCNMELSPPCSVLFFSVKVSKLQLLLSPVLWGCLSWAVGNLAHGMWSPCDYVPWGTLHMVSGVPVRAFLYDPDPKSRAIKGIPGRCLRGTSQGGLLLVYFTWLVLHEHCNVGWIRHLSSWVSFCLCHMAGFILNSWCIMSEK